MAKIVQEIYFQTPNKPGVLAQIAKSLGKAKINILDMCSFGEGKRGEVCLNTSNNQKARAVLKNLGYRPKQTQVIAANVANKPGRLAPILNRLARAHINIKSCEFTSSGKKVEVLLNTTKNKKAARMI